MRAQLELFDNERLWELGYIRQCLFSGIECRFDPCTIAQEVRCCAECMSCGNPCKIAAAQVRSKHK